MSFLRCDEVGIDCEQYPVFCDRKLPDLLIGIAG